MNLSLIGPDRRHHSHLGRISVTIADLIGVAIGLALAIALILLLFI